jgi:recombination protein RecR
LKNPYLLFTYLLFFSKLCIFFNLKSNRLCDISDVMSKYPVALQQLIASLKMLPGVGSKTAERFAFHLLTWTDDALHDFSSTASSLKTKIHTCSVCHCLKDSDPRQTCEFCDLSRRDASLLCLISSPKDAYAIEETHAYRGLYHVLGGLLSPLDGRTAERLNLPKLIERISGLQVKEVIVALDSTLEGDATALYLKEQLGKLGIPVSRLALGLPMGSALEYVDGGTLSRALSGRQIF